MTPSSPIPSPQSPRNNQSRIIGCVALLALVAFIGLCVTIAFYYLQKTDAENSERARNERRAERTRTVIDTEVAVQRDQERVLPFDFNNIANVAMAKKFEITIEVRKGGPVDVFVVRGNDAIKVLIETETGIVEKVEQTMRATISHVYGMTDASNEHAVVIRSSEPAQVSVKAVTSPGD